MRINRIAAVVCLAITAFFVSASLAGDLPKLNLEHYKLSNGLDVILYEDHSIPMVSVNVWYHVGSQNEEIGRTGFAHLFEHLMFEGSEHHNVGFGEDINKFGGVNNGGTNADGTRYWENMPSNYLKKALWLEADRMGYLLPAITLERLENQRSIVINEKRQNYDDQPYGRARILLHEMLYPPDHPYSWITIGYTKDLEAATMEDVQSFFKKYYSPSNASLCIAGDFDPVQAKEWVESYFGHLPAGSNIDRLNVWTPEITKEKRKTYHDNIQLPRLYMAWHTPAWFAPGDAELDFFAGILSNGKSSRLYKTLVYDKQIAQDVSAFQSSSEIGSFFQIQVTAKEGHTLEELEAEVDKILNDLIANGPTVEEFERIRINWESGFVRQLQNIGGFGGIADKLNSYNTYVGRPDAFQWDKDRYANANIENMLSYAREYIKPQKRVVLYIEPRGELLANSMTPDMSVNPEGGKEPTFSPPEIQTAELSNGVELYLIEDHGLPLIQMTLLIKSGWAADPGDRPGASALTAELLNEGTKTKTSLEISDAFQLLGANFGVGSSWDHTNISLNVLKDKLDPAMELMADVVLNPSFPQEELDRQKQIYLGRIQQESMQAITVAFKGYLQNLYGANHPYGQPYTGSGTEESINGISRSDLEKYYKTNYLPNNTAAIVVGDITLDEAKSKLEEKFKKWKKGTPIGNPIEQVAPLNSTKIYIVDKPGAAQSAILMGNLVESRLDPDFLKGSVITNVLGGGSNARLYENLRKDKGYTYGAYSFVTARKGQGAFVCYAQVQGDATKESVSEFVKELRGMTGEIPMTAEELTESKDNLTKGFPQNFQTIGGIAGQMQTLIQYGLPLDSWKSYVDEINSVDVSTALDVARNKIHPDALLIFIVGDREKIEPGIRELDLGEIIFPEAK